MSAFRTLPVVTLALLVACAAPLQYDAGFSRAERLEALLSTLAADSMEGRRTGTPGARRAARFLASELERYGVEPAGDDGYFQRVPLAWIDQDGPNGPAPTPRPAVGRARHRHPPAGEQGRHRGERDRHHSRFRPDGRG